MPVLVARSISIATRRIILTKGSSTAVCLFSSSRFSSDKQHNVDSVHFRATSTPHPLASEGNSLKSSSPTPTLSGLDESGKPIVEVMKYVVSCISQMQIDSLCKSSLISLFQPFGHVIGDHTGLLQNHIWKEGELKEKLTTLYHHKPQTYTDHAMQKSVRQFEQPQRKIILRTTPNRFLFIILSDVWSLSHI